MMLKGFYKTGVDEIDRQNFNLINHIEAMMDPENKGTKLTQLQNFEGLVKKYFENEERLHAECRYLAADRHRYAHEVFIKMLQQIKREFIETGITLENENIFKEHVVGFFVNNIMDGDKTFGIFYHNNVLSKNNVGPVNPYVQAAV